MINKVGVSKIDNLDTEFFKDTSLEIEVNLNEKMPKINKITSIMCQSEEIEMEASKSSILLFIKYKVKIIYTSNTTDSLHIIEKNYVYFTTIYMPETIDGDTLKGLIKGKKIFPKVNIYELSETLLSPEKIFIKAYIHIRLNYKKGLSLALNIFQDKDKGNLYLSSLDFNLEQITFNNDTSIKSFLWDTDKINLYIIKREFDFDNVYIYNKKLKSEKILLDNFKEITFFKVFKNHLYILGETEFSKEIFKVSKGNFAIEEIYTITTEEILDFTLIEDNLILLIKNEDGALLKIISNNFLEEDKILSLQGENFYIKDTLLAFIGTDKSLILFDLYALNTLNNFNLKGFTDIKDIFIYNRDTIIINSNRTNLESCLFLIKNNKLTPLIKKPINIINASFDTTRKLLLLAIKVSNTIEIISLDIKELPSTVTPLFKVNSLNLTLKSL